MAVLGSVRHDNVLKDNGPLPAVVRQGTVALFGGDAGRERSVARAAFREVF